MLGADSVLPEELFEGILQGCGHHAVYALQTTRAEQLAKQHAEHHTEHHTRYSTTVTSHTQ